MLFIVISIPTSTSATIVMIMIITITIIEIAGLLAAKYPQHVIQRHRYAQTLHM